MTDKYIGDQKLVNVVLEQYHQYVRRHGKKPTKLVFMSHHYLSILDSEVEEILSYDTNDNVDVKKLMGMEVILLKDVYGGSFNWGFGE